MAKRKLAVRAVVRSAGRPFGPALTDAQRAKLDEVQARMAKKGPPKKPMGLEAVRNWYSLSYDDLALVIGAADRGHAWNMAVGKMRPKWEYAKWIVAQLGGAVTLETLTDLSVRK